MADKVVDNAARRALRGRLKTRFFHKWENPNYTSREQWHAGINARLRSWPSSFTSPHRGTSEGIQPAPLHVEGMPGEFWIYRNYSNPDQVLLANFSVFYLNWIANDLGLLCEEIDDCYKYIAALEQQLSDLESAPVTPRDAE